MCSESDVRSTCGPIDTLLQCIDIHHSNASALPCSAGYGLVTKTILFPLPSAHWVTVLSKLGDAGGIVTRGGVQCVDRLYYHVSLG